MAGIKEIIDLVKDGVNKKEEELINKAYEFAKHAHEGQKRLSGEPYFVHAFETAKILAKFGMDAQTIAAGLLHDVLEDTPTPEEEMEKEFGEDILFLVKGVTKLGKLKYRGHERHVESLRRFFIAMANDLRVVVIKFADRLHNLRTLQFVREDKRQRIAIESIEVYAPLANRLGMGKLKGELEDAAFPYAYPEEYKKTEEIIKEKEEFFKKHLAEVREKLKRELGKNRIKFEIDYRIKHKYSLYKKLQRYEMDIEKIYDVVALRVVVGTVEGCYRVLGMVHAIWNPMPGRIKDYIAVPKPNGYRSLHTTIFTGASGGIAEIQIRTKEMHLEADYGIAAHFAYKEHGNKKLRDDKDKFKWIEELKELKYSPGNPQRFIDHLKMDFFSDRIFIFTPKGDVIDMPEDSSPLDFAYAIHSDVGEHTSAAKINGKMSQIYAKLSNGDMVEIMTKKDAKPSSKWLDYAKTTNAKKRIKSYLEKHSLLAKLKSFGKS